MARQKEYVYLELCSNFENEFKTQQYQYTFVALLQKWVERTSSKIKKNNKISKAWAPSKIGIEQPRKLFNLGRVLNKLCNKEWKLIEMDTYLDI